MKRYILYFIIAFLSAAVAGCGDRQQSSMLPPVRVKCDTARAVAFSDNLQFPARVRAAEEVNMAFKVSGALVQVLVREGQFVRQGQLLARIDSRDYELQLQAAEAEWLSIKAEAERVASLYADSVATAADYDKARYGLRQITAKQDNAKNQLADTKIYAPFDGYVKRRLFDPPMVVAAGMPVVTLHSSSMPEVEISIPSSAYNRLNDIVSFVAKFDFLEDAVPLRIISVSSDVNANQLYTVRLALPATIKVKPAAGMFTMVDALFRAEAENMVEIPANAIFHASGSDCVWVVAGDSVVKRRIEVEELHTDGTATVSSGLKDGEVVVSAGVGRLKEGRNVRPLPQVNKSNAGGLL